MIETNFLQARHVVRTNGRTLHSCLSYSYTHLSVPNLKSSQERILNKAIDTSSLFGLRKWRVMLKLIYVYGDELRTKLEKEREDERRARHSFTLREVVLV